MDPIRLSDEELAQRIVEVGRVLAADETYMRERGWHADKELRHSVRAAIARRARELKLLERERERRRGDGV